MAEFVLPEFLENCDAETIHERMLALLPKDIDRTEGGFPWDFTRPTALIAAEFLEFFIPETIKIALPQFSYGQYLEWLGEPITPKKQGTKATVTLHVTGLPGTVIPAGTVFATASVDEAPSIEFETIDEWTISENGECHLEVKALEVGFESNVAIGTISIMSEPIDGIETIINEEAATGGTDEEDDESYRKRILDYEKNQDQSYVGNDADFIRWAKEVNGIGDCIVSSDGEEPGVVRLILVDSNGRPASQALIDNVYDHIVSPGDRSKRLLPTGSCELIISPASLKEIEYVCTGVILDGITVETATEAFRSAIQTVYTTAKKEGILRYNDVRPLLAEIGGVEDFDEFTMNGSHANISFGPAEYAETSSIVFVPKEG